MTYVVMPTSGLPTLEQALALVAGPDLGEQSLLRPRVVEGVVDDVVAERCARDRSLLERLERLAQRLRELLRVRLVRVSLQRLRQLEALLGRRAACRDQRGEREMGIHVAAVDQRLDPLGRTAADHPKAARPVVVQPPEPPASRPNFESEKSPEITAATPSAHSDHTPA